MKPLKESRRIQKKKMCLKKIFNQLIYYDKKITTEIKKIQVLHNKNIKR